MAPRTLRGRLTTINVLMITFGQLVSYLINIAFATTNEGWRYMFGIAAAPALIQLCSEFYFSSKAIRLMPSHVYSLALRSLTIFTRKPTSTGCQRQDRASYSCAYEDLWKERTRILHSVRAFANRTKYRDRESRYIQRAFQVLQP